MTLLRHCWIVTVDDALTDYPDGYIAFDSSGILAVGDEKTIPSAWKNRGEDRRGCLVIPGFCNTHTHISMVPFRSLGDDCRDRLRRFLMPLENEAMTEKLAKAAAKVAICEFLLAGTTSAVDMYYFEDSVAEAAEEMGFRLWAGETELDAARPDGTGLESAFRTTARIEEMGQGNPLIRAVVAPHAPYSLSIDSLKACHAYAEKHDLLWTMHLEEMKPEMASFHSSWGMTPAEKLDAEHILDDRLLAVHAVLAEEKDIRLLAERHASIAHCPGANAKSARGVAMIPEFIAMGGRAGLATDGPSSGNTLDEFTLMRLYALLQKNRLQDRSAIPARSIVPLACREPGKILRAPVGQLRKGYQADIAVLSLAKPNMVPCYDPYSVLVYSAQPQNVKDVYVAGVQKVRDGALFGIDEKGIADAFREAGAGFEAAARRRLSSLEREDRAE